MERKIGEIFEYEGEKLKVIKAGTACDGCYFKGKSCDNRNYDITGICGWTRKDNQSVRFIKVTEEQQAEQPQKLNLCEILKYCPVGEPFWSPILDNVTLLEIDQEAKKVTVETISPRYSWDINNDGTITIDEVTSPEIMLYPSREQRDWSKYKYEPKKELPKTWEEFCKNYERKKGDSYIDLVSKICTCNDSGFREIDRDRNVLPSKQAAEAHLAYMQLHQLRDAWREGWLPDWKDERQSKYVIMNLHGIWKTAQHTTTSRFLAFQDKKRADEFKDCFINLIRKAGDLI